MTFTLTARVLVCPGLLACLQAAGCWGPRALLQLQMQMELELELDLERLDLECLV